MAERPNEILGQGRVVGEEKENDGRSRGAKVRTLEKQEPPIEGSWCSQSSHRRYEEFQHEVDEKVLTLQKAVDQAKAEQAKADRDFNRKLVSAQHSTGCFQQKKRAITLIYLLSFNKRPRKSVSEKRKSDDRRKNKTQRKLWSKSMEASLPSAQMFSISATDTSYV